VALVIEDEAGIRRFLRAALESQGFTCVEATTGSEGIAHAATRAPEIILLDLGLPDMDGLDVMRRIREWSTVPIVVLTARGKERDKIDALDGGADDYVTKPFSPRELVARVKAILRRSEGPRQDAPTVMTIGEVEVDIGRREARVSGAPVALAAREFDLLAFLAENRGLALSRRQLLDGVWGADWIGDERTVDVHVRQLRKKLGDAFPLSTVWGVGYRLD
jgi:DNA-binding response OmpR family regulator